ncbi:hypothetical protein SAMD00023353_0902300 [Rosellinia necatrix]|uniref:Uncharacterized protein n=1 Tax=Rosellinia necatrix TaxID=77044 RepID=A0A1W2TLD3_ROSNE|nr:hypothetical protein SAMD00023353_0902300 [Rosellinia necatrix]
MALALRLTALSYVVARAEARWFQTGSDAGDWTPATPTAEPATLSPDEWAPKTTSAPRGRPLDWGLRRRGEISPAVCGYPVDDSRGRPITCGSGESCRLDRISSIVGCCTETNPRGCIVPTTCLEASNSAQWSGDSLTVYCSDSARPHCVTLSYEANFYDLLYGASFIGCAARAASGDIIAVSPMTGTDASPTRSLSTFTTTNAITTATVVTSLPGNGGSSTAVPSSGGNSSSKNVGAIAGGTVGGVAGLALIVVAMLFCLHRRKKRSQEQEPDPLAFGQKMPPSEHDVYHNEAIPGSQYPSTFFGEAPPGMVQASEQPAVTYPPNTYGFHNNIYTAGQENNVGAPSAYHNPRVVPSKPQDDAVSPIEDSPVSPVSPAENYNTMVSALSNQSPPLQPLQPAVHRPQSEYAQYSPPPPEQYQSYHPYPGT